MKVCLIGIGAIAPIHILALKAANQDIVALCDVIVDRCVAANEKFGLSAAVYDDYKKMIDVEKPDCVHICTPHYLHAEMVCYALDGNVNVVCEKPIAINYRQLDAIRRSVQHSSAQVGVCQQNRFNAAIKYVKDFFSDKKIVAASGTLSWQRNAAYYDSAEWRGKEVYEGGGVAINQALHTLDLLQWFCGMPSSVVGRCFNDTLKNVIDVEETAFGVFKLPDGGRFVLSATNAGAFSFPINIMLRSEHDEAIVLGDNIILNGKFLTRSDGLPLFGKEVWGTGHRTFVKEFYDCLEKGKHFPIDFEEAQKVIRLILALYRSNGQEVEVE